MVAFLFCFFACVSLGILLRLFAKKLPQLRMLNPHTSETIRSSELKNKILRERIERASGKGAKALHTSVIAPAAKGVQDAFRRLAGRLVAADRAHKKKRREQAGVDGAVLEERLQEGLNMMQAEHYDRAEKAFIEVISADPKHVQAYESLGRLYLQKKEYDSAKETFRFLAKLSPDDASVLASLGEVERLLKNEELAKEYFEKATELQPKNPKYLDFLIDSLILLKDKKGAKATLKILTSVNPENKKIEEFNLRIAEL
ncbi:MAG: tetratricopeptide repeat protein [bacterium]|nr:tetratricopeptide repeat protein [bacterium]